MRWGVECCLLRAQSSVECNPLNVTKYERLHQQTDYSAQSKEPEETCSLCLSSLDGYKITTMCGHAFHLSCFMQARQHGATSAPSLNADLAPTGRHHRNLLPLPLSQRQQHIHRWRVLWSALRRLLLLRRRRLRPAPMVIGSLGAVTFARGEEYQQARLPSLCSIARAEQHRAQHKFERQPPGARGPTSCSNGSDNAHGGVVRDAWSCNIKRG